MIEAETSSKLKVQVTRDTATSRLGKISTFERRILLSAIIGHKAMALITRETAENSLLVENRLCDVLEDDVDERGSLARIYKLVQCKEKSKSQRLCEILMNY